MDPGPPWIILVERNNETKKLLYVCRREVWGRVRRCFRERIRLQDKQDVEEELVNDIKTSIRDSQN